VLDPKGPIGVAERSILLNSLAIMLVVVVPVIVLTLAFAWWYRASNSRARYQPDWAYSGRLEFIVWAIPALIVMFLGGVAWVGSHALDPWKPIASNRPPLEVQVVSMDWKWLFLYPDIGIASVNEVVVPAGTPIHFRLTSDTVMNSFFVPQLGGQIYTMAGMESQLYLLADEPGVFAGISAQFSGAGFPDMQFRMRAVGNAEFADWSSKTRGAGETLDLAAYERLALPGVERQPRTYGAITADLFYTIVSRFTAKPEAAAGAGRDLHPTHSS